MTSLSSFSAPVAVLVNGCLYSQRGGIVSAAGTSEDEVRFKIFVDQDPFSVRFGLTLQISALRDMSKEHNPDHIPDYQAHIFFPAKGIFEYEINIPLNLPGYPGVPRAFRINHTIEFGSALVLSFTCRGPSSEKDTLPQLRYPKLESSLKRLFGIVDTAASLTNACLEVDCLVNLVEEGNRGILFAINSMQDTIIREMDQRLLQKRLTGLSMSKKLPHPAKQNQKFKNKNNLSTHEGRPTQKSVPSAIIDGRFVSPDKRSERQSATTAIPNTSAMKYLHPHAFDLDY